MLKRPEMSDPNSSPWNTPHDLVGSVLADRYQVKRLLGDGGMGSVYLGEHTTLRKKVAIKVLHQELCRDQMQVDRFLQEARAASMIGHENIVDIVDFGPVPGGSVFFAMEYLEGEDLSDLVKREGRLPWARARELMVQIVRALRAAHDTGIIHRDLKPANCFLVKRSDGRDFVKLLDFGIAKVTDPETGDGGGLTRTGAVFGTAKYMAPEQACGETADQRTDVYAAAICLYEFLTGSVPYDGDNFMRVLSRHLTEPLTLPSTMAPEANIAPAVEAIIVKALSKKREDRYQHMGEFEEALLAVGPDGNLKGQLYEGPPMAAPADGKGGTMWMGQAAAGSHGPASQPPEGPRGTMLLDADSVDASQPDGIYGTVKLDQPYQDSRPPVAAQPAGGYQVNSAPAAGATPITRNPGPAPSQPPPPPPDGASAVSVAPASADRGGDYTMFATETRSPAKFAVLLVVGAIAVIGLASAAAFLLLDDGDDDTVAVAKPDAEPEPPKKNEEPETDKPPPPEPDPIPEIPETPEIPQDPPPDDPPPEDPPDDPPPDDPEPRTTKKRPVKRPPKKPATIKASLSPGDVTTGFRKAQGTASACGGWIPGMSIKVKATINAEGKVVSASPQSNTGLPVAKCVANAVQSKARFVKTQKALDVKTFTYKK